MDFIYEIARNASPELKFLLWMTYKDLYKRLKIRVIPYNSKLSDILTNKEILLFPDLYELDISWNIYITHIDIKHLPLKKLIMKGRIKCISILYLHNTAKMPIEYIDISDNPHGLITYEFMDTLKVLISNGYTYNEVNLINRFYPKLFVLSNCVYIYRKHIQQHPQIKADYLPKLHYYIKNDIYPNLLNNKIINIVKKPTKRILPKKIFEIYIKNNKYLSYKLPVKELWKSNEKKYLDKPIVYATKIFPHILRKLKIDINSFPSICFSIKTGIYRYNKTLSYKGVVCNISNKKYEYSVYRI